MTDDSVKQTKENKKKCNLKGPGPGRPKGSKNRYTAFITDLFEVWEETKGVERLKDFIEKSDRNFGKYIEVLAKLMPKEVKLTGDLDAEVTIKKDYGAMDYEQLAREFNQKVRATRLLLSESGSGPN